MKLLFRFAVVVTALSLLLVATLLIFDWSEVARDVLVPSRRQRVLWASSIIVSGPILGVIAGAILAGLVWLTRPNFRQLQYGFAAAVAVSVTLFARSINRIFDIWLGEKPGHPRMPFLSPLIRDLYDVATSFFETTPGLLSVALVAWAIGWFSAPWLFASQHADEARVGTQ